MVKHRFALVCGVVALALALSGVALANDCMRVSSSLQGLQQSADKSGNWLFFDMTDSGSGVSMVLEHFGIPVTTQQVACFQSAYDASTGPKYFAIGIGVAGGHSGNGPQVLAHNAPDKVLTNGTGIDHFDDSVLPIFLAAVPTCLGP